MAAQVGLDPSRISTGSPTRRSAPIERFVEGKIDACLGLPPEPQDLRARQLATCSSIPRWTTRGLNISAVCWGAMRTMCRCIRSRPSGCCERSSKQRISAPPSRHALRDASSTAVSLRARLCAPDAERRPLRQMARVRCRGHDPLLCLAPARSGLHQVEPAKDHRRRHGLALSRRAQTGAEGVSAKVKGRLPLPAMQTRRRFLYQPVIGGCRGPRPRAANAGRGGRPRNDDGPPREDAEHLRCPRRMSPRSCCAPRALPIFAMCLCRWRGNVPDAIERGAIDFGLNYASVLVGSDRSRRRDEDVGWRTRRLLRGVRE